MPRGVYKPNQELIILLNEMEDSKVEVTQVRDRFEQKYQTKKPKSELRRWVQGQFRTLQKHGFVSEDEENQSPKQYNITEKIRAYLSGAAQANTPSETAQIATTIRTRLAEVKVQMIKSKAEALEYERLSELYPQLRHQLSQKYNATKERELMLDGQLTAIESTLQTVESGL